MTGYITSRLNLIHRNSLKNMNGQLYITHSVIVIEPISHDWTFYISQFIVYKYLNIEKNMNTEKYVKLKINKNHA